MVAMTLLVRVSTTETVSEPWLATYTRVPSRLTAIPLGSAPTGTVAMTLPPPPVLMTETVLEICW